MIHSYHAKKRPRSLRQRGFTLLEVLVSILLTAIGIFGFAKMQALAMSSTQVAAGRSLVTLQAGSLAAAMQGNRAYWGAGLAPSSVTMANTTVTDSTGVLSASVSTCEANSKPSDPLCTPAQLAAWDIQKWAENMNNLVPTYNAAVNCSTTAGVPVTCTITVKWTEKYVSANKSTVSDSSATGGERAYTLHVEP